MSMGEKILTADPAAGYRAHRAELEAAVRRVLDSGWYILGAEVAAFEQEFAAWLGAGQALGVANGTDALHLALRACGVAPGDLVFTVSHTAVATVAAIELAGAVPVLVDIDPVTYTLCPRALRAALEACAAGPEAGRMRAIIAVHLYGQPADVDALAALAREFGLRLIEDCAQAHGAQWRGQTVGTFGDAAAFSFYPTKNLGALGDGGAVVTSDAELAARVRLLREYGWRERYISAVAGMNSRLDELQAALLRVKLRHLAADNARRGALACAYHGALAGTGLVLPATPAHVRHVYHQYVVATERREALRAFLGERGIVAQIHYPAAVHQQPAYAAARRGPGGLPATEALVPRILSLPMHPELADAQQARVVAAILEWAAGPAGA